MRGPCPYCSATASLKPENSAAQYSWRCKKCEMSLLSQIEWCKRIRSLQEEECVDEPNGATSL